jgi:hypothetical protein
MKLLAVFVIAMGCSAYPTYRPVPPPDCEVEKQYEQLVHADQSFEMVGDTGRGWTATDMSPGSVMSGIVQAIPGGPRCGSTAALVITAANNNEWGSLFGMNNFGKKDATGYEGLSFWARAPIGSNTTFTILFDDSNTGCLGTPDEQGKCTVLPSNCIVRAVDGGTSSGGNIDPGTGMVIAGTVTDAPEPDQCGNSYSTVHTVSPLWTFYTIPFTEFHQGLLPNRVPNEALTMAGPLPGTGLRIDELLTLVFRMPKAMPTELWIDNVGFYRKATATGGDGGVDAPQP